MRTSLAMVDDWSVTSLVVSSSVTTGSTTDDSSWGVGWSAVWNVSSMVTWSVCCAVSFAVTFAIVFIWDYQTSSFFHWHFVISEWVWDGKSNSNEAQNNEQFHFANFYLKCPC